MKQPDRDRDRQAQEPADIGAIIQFAVSQSPTVRGVHLQPVSYFGRYPSAPNDRDRVTIPEVLRAIEAQTNGRISQQAFKPSGCENALCSFHADLVLMPDGTLHAWTRRQPAESSCCCQPERAEEGAARTRLFTARHWSHPAQSEPSACCEQGATKEAPSLGDWDVLLARAQTHTLTLSGMAFQDAWNLDLERLRDCCIHTVSPDGRLIPFCAYNLTSAQGRPLYREGGRVT